MSTEKNTPKLVTDAETMKYFLRIVIPTFFFLFKVGFEAYKELLQVKFQTENRTKVLIYIPLMT